jgi:hypothetical protein
VNDKKEAIHRAMSGGEAGHAYASGGASILALVLLILLVIYLF